jgi:hypothetical protein
MFELYSAKVGSQFTPKLNLSEMYYLLFAMLQVKYVLVEFENVHFN